MRDPAVLTVPQAVRDRYDICPACGHADFVVDEYWAATGTDPEAIIGHCACCFQEMLSECCDATFGPGMQCVDDNARCIAGFCSRCGNGAGFDTANGCKCEFQT